jgi:hypothetical protein
VNVVIHHHYQQYQDVCMVMVEQNHDHVYPNQMHEQEKLRGIDGHVLSHCWLDCYIEVHQLLHRDQQ